MVEERKEEGGVGKGQGKEEEFCGPCIQHQYHYVMRRIKSYHNDVENDDNYDNGNVTVGGGGSNDV